MTKLMIPTPLRKFTNDEGVFESESKTVKGIITDLVVSHPGLKQHLLDENDNIRSFVRIYVGEDDINSLDRENTAVSDGQLVSIIPAIAGGSI